MDSIRESTVTEQNGREGTTSCRGALEGIEMESTAGSCRAVDGMPGPVTIARPHRPHHDCRLPSVARISSSEQPPLDAFRPPGKRAVVDFTVSRNGTQTYQQWMSQPNGNLPSTVQMFATTRCAARLRAGSENPYSHHSSPDRRSPHPRIIERNAPRSASERICTSVFSACQRSKSARIFGRPTAWNRQMSLTRVGTIRISGQPGGRPGRERKRYRTLRPAHRRSTTERG